MEYSVTGLVDAAIALSLVFLTWRLHRSWRRSGTLTAKVLTGVSIFYFLHFAGVALASTVFLGYAGALLAADILGAFWQGLAGGVGGYLSFKLLFPGRNAWYGFALVFMLGLATMTATYFVPTVPHIEPVWNTIEWNHTPLESIPRILVFLATFLPILYVLWRQTFALSTLKEKVKGTGIGLIFVTGIVAALFDFMLEPRFGASPILGEVFLALMALDIFLLTLVVPYLPEPRRGLAE